VNDVTAAEGWSPLHLAVMCRRSSIVQLLLAHPSCKVCTIIGDCTHEQPVR
jgi:ankyrin repeat protein